ncbi:hypothetical protein [Streptomyces roseirectus]|uniref:hypothetical protein n=1 Tax=Streptomyces roseirectus TaxID=2768066 RepID=UPI001FE96695|nr:hypothetical protein [Streptomyces roseirectus]
MATSAETPVTPDPVTGPARSPRTATRVLGQGYAHLLTAMALRGEGLGLAPSELVDVGVHTIILATVAYAELCGKYDGGHFPHHVPKVQTDNDGSAVKTVHLVARAGWEVDLPLREDAAEARPGDVRPNRLQPPARCRADGLGDDY